jgi:hypothetical protein
MNQICKIEFVTGGNVMNKILLATTIVILSACAKHDDPSKTPPSSGSEPTYTDPSILTDTYEKEILLGCEGQLLSDKIVRRAMVNTFRINPDRNFAINSSAFVNLETSSEFVPRPVFVTAGGDNYKYITFCQPPATSGCNMAVVDGYNRIEYKYWSYKYTPCANDPTQKCNKEDILEEQGTRVMHFTHLKVQSDKICRRKPSVCPLTSSPTWGACEY